MLNSYKNTTRKALKNRETNVTKHMLGMNVSIAQVKLAVANPYIYTL